MGKESSLISFIVAKNCMSISYFRVQHLQNLDSHNSYNHYNSISTSYFWENNDILKICSHWKRVFQKNTFPP